MLSTNKEILERAAKAAGNPSGTSRAGGGLLMANDLYWNPLTSDGDAFRLAVVCMVSFGFYRFFKQCLKTLAARRGLHEDPYDVVRYVVVEAATTLVENK